MKKKTRPLATPGSYSPLKSPMSPQDKWESSVTNDLEIRHHPAEKNTSLKVNYRRYDWAKVTVRGNQKHSRSYDDDIYMLWEINWQT